MGHRLSKIYTRTGDKGTTGLGDGTRIEKDHPRVEAMGEVDELNSVIGLLLTHALSDVTRQQLTRIQSTLFDLGGELCMPGREVMQARDAEQLEQELDAMNEHLPPLKEFILPGGSAAATVCHVARAVCRRVERRVVTLAHAHAVNAYTIKYVNRLSDYLFVLARHLNKISNTPEVLWEPRKK